MKKIILALVLSFCVTSAFAKDVWEYHSFKTGRLNYISPEHVKIELNKRGKRGWELVSVQTNDIQTWFFFKRKK